MRHLAGNVSIPSLRHVKGLEDSLSEPHSSFVLRIRCSHTQHLVSKLRAAKAAIILALDYMVAVQDHSCGHHNNHQQHHNSQGTGSEQRDPQPRWRHSQ